MTKKKEVVTESQSFTCPNPSCGRAFANPIKAENLGSEKAGSYYACPYCLAEITVEKGSSIIEEKQKLEVKEIKSKRARVHPAEKKPVQSAPKVKGCAHYFGYLSKRSSKEKIPEECIICENIVQCMLKNVTG